MEKLFAGAAAAVVLAFAASAWATSPDAPVPPPAPEPAAQTVVAQAHLVFANAPGTPVVSDLTVVQQGSDFAIVRTSFSGTAAQPPAPVAAPPTADRATRNTKG